MNIDSKTTRQNGGHARWTFRLVKGLPLAAVVVGLTIFIAASQSSSAPFPVWVSPALIRVGQTDAPGMTSSISLSGARGETVDTQVIVQAPANGLTNVNVSASALTGPSGATIPASSITLYREYFITVTAPRTTAVAAIHRSEGEHMLSRSSPLTIQKPAQRSVEVRPLLKPATQVSAGDKINLTGSTFRFRMVPRTARREIIPARSLSRLTKVP
jgi:hypothetical protein